MNLKGIKSRSALILLLVVTLFLWNCGGPRYLSVPEVKKDQSVKVYLKNGQVQEGIVTEQTGSALGIISASDHQPYTLNSTEISRVEISGYHYDYRGYPISSAEIEKYKKNRNTWGYAIGGAVVGGLAGLAVGYPIWVANDNPPPLFAAGIGAVIGSIYFASRGIKKDQQVAINQVRYIRDKEHDLEQQKQAEEEKLKEIERQKQELQKQLEEKKKDRKDPVK
jgi:hypothetical protein